MSTPQTIHAEIAAAWNARNFDAMARLLHPEYTYAGPDGRELPGVEAAMAVAKLFANAFPDATLTVDRVAVSGNTAVGEMTGRGTHNGDLMGIPPTGRYATMPICNVIEMRDGKVYREREYFDMVNMLTQLGVSTLPTRAASA